jgi:hypothetical protein
VAWAIDAGFDRRAGETLRQIRSSRTPRWDRSAEALEAVSGGSREWSGAYEPRGWLDAVVLAAFTAKIPLERD